MPAKPLETLSAAELVAELGQTLDQHRAADEARRPVYDLALKTLCWEIRRRLEEWDASQPPRRKPRKKPGPGKTG